jgi:hypothetical protein
MKVHDKLILKKHNYILDSALEERCFPKIDVCLHGSGTQQ